MLLITHVGNFVQKTLYLFKKFLPTISKVKNLRSIVIEVNQYLGSNLLKKAKQYPWPVPSMTTLNFPVSSHITISGVPSPGKSILSSRLSGPF